MIFIETALLSKVWQNHLSFVINIMSPTLYEGFSSTLAADVVQEGLFYFPKWPNSSTFEFRLSFLLGGCV